MAVSIIFNPKSGSSEGWDAVRAGLERLPGAMMHETNAPGDARRIARDRAAQRDELVVAVGGDGTVHEVVNGLMDADIPRPPLAIVPMGTGNDLVRTLDIPLDPAKAVALLADPALHRAAALDLVSVRADDYSGYSHNAAAGGFTGRMNEALTDEVKSRWGPLAYLRGAAQILPDLEHYKTDVWIDGRNELKAVHLMNVIVANGRTAGGGTVVAPLADPSDGLLDVVVVRTGTALELAGVAARLLGGDYTSSDLVHHYRAKSVRVKSDPGMWFNVDGELVTNRPITFTIVPRALDVIVPVKT